VSAGVGKMPPLRTRRPVDIWAPILLAVLAAAAMLVNLTRWPRFEDDEGTYVGQADAILTGNITPYTYTYDHPFGAWFQMAPFYEVLKSFGLDANSSIYAGRLIMVLFGAAAAGLIYLITRRVGGQVAFSVIASLVWITSGLIHDDARGVYLDNVAIVWVLLALYLALSPHQHLWHYVGSGAAFGVAVLSKETMALFGPAILLAMWQSSWKRLRVMHISAFLASGILVGLAYPLFAVLKSEFWFSDARSSLLSELWWQFGGRDGSGWLWDSTSQRNTIVMDWVYYDRWILYVGVVAGLACLFRKQTRSIGLAVAFGLIPVFLLSGYLPSMYHLALDPFFAIAIGAVLSWLGVIAVAGWRGRKTRGGALRLVGAVAALGVLAASAVVYVLPERISRMDDAWTKNGVGAFYDFRQTALTSIPEGDVVVTNGELWNDFRSAGWDIDEVIPYTKIDRDPSLADAQPQWLVITPTMTRDTERDGAAIKYKELLANSVAVEVNGDYEIRRVLP
jgi:4-amino-4-deoxy-L-arabinose transferase-like glycosyltransferase